MASLIPRLLHIQQPSTTSHLRARCGHRVVAPLGRPRRLRVAALAQKAEYIWFDGSKRSAPSAGSELRSKTKVYPTAIPVGGEFSDWAFDGSCTSARAAASDSDCILRPVFSCPDPIRGEQHVLVLCEVLNSDGTPHRTNSRAALQQVVDGFTGNDAPLFGFEQEYTMLGRDGRVLGWPAAGIPHPDGSYYCGVGQEAAHGRPLAEAHLDACVRAGLTISGINAEACPGQWEFQIGPGGPYEMPDHVMVARWLLHRIGEDFGVTVSLDPTPVSADWHGAAGNTNFSTARMRRPGGMEHIEAAIASLQRRHTVHMAEYGGGARFRRSDPRNTLDVGAFQWGVADRTASIRIPRAVAIAGYGYLEDRRPSADVDPYTVARLLIETCIPA